MTPEAPSTLTTAGVAATQAALAAEFAVAYGYGVVGAHVTGALRAAAVRAMQWHQTQQADLVAELQAAGAQPVVAGPAYALPFAITGTATAARLAVELEVGAAACWADLVAERTGAGRLTAAAALAQCAVRAAYWRPGSVPFPGLPERSS